VPLLVFRQEPSWIISLDVIAEWGSAVRIQPSECLDDSSLASLILAHKTKDLSKFKVAGIFYTAKVGDTDTG
jgi:hypothetical protein